MPLAAVRAMYTPRAIAASNDEPIMAGRPVKRNV